MIELDGSSLDDMMTNFIADCTDDERMHFEEFAVKIYENDEFAVREVSIDVDQDELKATMMKYWDGEKCTDEELTTWLGLGVKSSFFDKWEQALAKKKCELNDMLFRKYMATLKYEGLNDEEEKELIELLGEEKVSSVMKYIDRGFDEFSSDTVADALENA